MLPLGLYLYGGLPGIALFLAYLGYLSGKDRYTALARAALTTIRGQVQRRPEAMQFVGGFSGWGGLIYVFTHLGTLWQERTLLAEAERLVSHVARLYQEDHALDVMQGTAGALASLFCLYRCRPSTDLLTVMRQGGEHLLAKPLPMSADYAWITPLAPQPLAGFSHGLAGIGSALLRLFALTAEQRFYAAARAAFLYEETLFDEERGNWRDLRAEAAEDTDIIARCHGAPGIGLARLASLPYVDTSEIQRDIDRALRVTLARGFGQNHSLCHGDFGNLEILLLARQKWSQLPRSGTWASARSRATDETS